MNKMFAPVVAVLWLFVLSVIISGQDVIAGFPKETSIPETPSGIKPLDSLAPEVIQYVDINNNENINVPKNESLQRLKRQSEPDRRPHRYPNRPNPIYTQNLHTAQLGPLSPPQNKRYPPRKEFSATNVVYEKLNGVGRVTRVTGTITFVGLGLGTGSGTSGNAGRQLRTMGGYRDDQRGHIIASRLGGDGRNRDNLYAQNKFVNNADNKRYEGQIAETVKRAGLNVPMILTVDLVYDNARDIRPTRTIMTLRRQDGTITFGPQTIENPISAPMSPGSPRGGRRRYT